MYRNRRCSTDINGRVVDSEEKPLNKVGGLISTGIYVIRRRLLIQLIENCIAEDRYDFVNDIIIRNKSTKKIYVYKIDTYWKNISSVKNYYDTNMDFLKPEVRDFFFRQYPDIYSKVEDLPPAKYNTGADVSNSLISSGSIIKGKVEGSVVFKQALWLEITALLKIPLFLMMCILGITRLLKIALWKVTVPLIRESILEMKMN